MAKKPTASVGIVGGGPAGLSLAKMLVERDAASVTVFESNERVGGKSYTIEQGGSAHDMGTCYSTLSYRITDRWMARYGLKQRGLGRQLMDDAPFMAFVNAEPGGSMILEMGRYLRARREFAQMLARTPDSEATRDALAEPFSVFLERHRLPRMRRFMLRAFTSIGYGPLEVLPTVQALRWATPRLFMTGLLSRLRLPVDGWQPLWERIAAEIDVRRSEPVQGLERARDGRLILHTPTGANVFDHVVITTPLDELAATSELSADERLVAQACRWNVYVTTLCRVTEWFQGHAVEAYSEPLAPDAPAGMLLSVRRDVPRNQPGAESELYLTGQYGHDVSPVQLKDRLADEIARRGGQLQTVYCQKRWKYFPRYASDAIRDGLVARMNAMQGVGNVWYSGAAFSHEAVGNIVDFNNQLAAEMAPRLAEPRAPAARRQEPARESFSPIADPPPEKAVPAEDRAL